MAKYLQAHLDKIGTGYREPETFFEIGKHYLASGSRYDALIAYTDGIYFSRDPEQILAALADLKNEGSSDVTNLIENLLALSLAARFPVALRSSKVNIPVTKDVRKLDKSVVVIVDSSGSSFNSPETDFRGTMLEAFRDYFGTLIVGEAGGLVTGICTEIQEANPKSVYSVAYLPSEKAGSCVWCKENRTVQQGPGNLAKPVQYWADIFTSGTRTENVKFIGFGTGPDALLEYAIAAALGASICMFEEYREIMKEVVKNPLYSPLEKIIYMPRYDSVMRAWIGTGLPGFPEDMREIIARALHEAYKYVESPFRTEETMVEWDALSDELKDSNLKAADHVVQKFREIGYKIELAEYQEITPVNLTQDEIEILGAMEHSRWISERLTGGWTFGAVKSTEKKTDPNMKPWSELDDDVREVDKMLVGKLPLYLSHFDLALTKVATKS